MNTYLLLPIHISIASRKVVLNYPSHNVLYDHIAHRFQHDWHILYPNNSYVLVDFGLELFHFSLGNLF